MSANNPTDDSTDAITRLVRAYADAVGTTPGEKAIPMATDNVDDVVRSQLTESTGTHFLDSGGATGRHWQKNQDNPPWEQPEWEVGDGYVTHNVYHYLTRTLGRDRTCVALETALYAYGYHGEGDGDGWLTCMEDFAESLLDGEATAEALEDLGVPPEFVEDVLGFQADVSGGSNPPFTFNTYNGECHSLSQVVQATHFGGPYSDYVMVQVHQGADVRGGYTGPRVYKDEWGGVFPGELEFRCEQCEWHDAESCIYGHDDLIYQRSIDPFELEEEGLIDEGDEEHPALKEAYQAEADGRVDGAVFHRCEDGGLGYVTF